jgi:hypothetical protein
MAEAKSSNVRRAKAFAGLITFESNRQPFDDPAANLIEQ